MLQLVIPHSELGPPTTMPDWLCVIVFPVLPAPTAPIPAPVTPVNSRLLCALVVIVLPESTTVLLVPSSWMPSPYPPWPADAPVEVAPDTALPLMVHVPGVATKPNAAISP